MQTNYFLAALGAQRELAAANQALLRERCLVRGAFGGIGIKVAKRQADHFLARFVAEQTNQRWVGVG